jgi:hypothetical protein
MNIIPKAIREFAAGVRAIPDMARLLPKVTDALNRWRGERESELDGEARKRIREVDDAKQITEIVRSSRDEYTRKWKTELEQHRKTIKSLTSETAARKEAERRLDALTRWRKHSEEPCPDVLADVEYSQDGTGTDGKCCYFDIEDGTYWRHTPESLVAMKKAKSDD